MPLLKLLKYPDPKLRKICIPVTEHTNFEKIQSLIDKMFELMYFFKGIGLAAPQVGVSFRVVVVDIEDNHPLGMINPEILESSGEIEIEEGCLSIPFSSGLVKRPNKIKAEYIDYFGKKQTLDAEGLKAVCIQHEIDHLNGKLYIDYLSRLRQDMIKRRLKKSF